MSRKIEIIRRAVEIFEKKGYNNTSISDIANEIGVKREAIYYYFRGRIDILLEIILPQSEALLRGLNGILERDIPPSRKLKLAVENHISAFNPGYLEMTVALREYHFTADGSPKFKRLRQTWDRYSVAWTELVAEGQARGEFKTDVDAKVVAYGILGACNWLSRWYDPEGDITLEQIQAAYSNVFLSGLEIGRRVEDDGH